MKIFLNFFLFLVFLINFLFAHNINLPYPYNTIEVMPFCNAGHFGPVHEKGLAHVIHKCKPLTIIEIGSYLGSSTRFMANLLPNDAIIYAVDPWQCSGAILVGNAPEHVQQSRRYYEQFLSNIIHTNLCYKIIPKKMTSVQALEQINTKADLIYIDGAHDFKSVYEDINGWYKRLNSNGILCGDDYGGASDRGFPIKRAVDLFAKQHNLKTHLIDNWFWYYEPKNKT